MSDFVDGPTDFDWSDITPIPQDDGPDPVVRIAYSSEFSKLMDIFRAVMHAKEYSPRVLKLTEELLDLNPASYTVWQYRRACLVALNADLNEELDYMDDFAAENPKNYQIWHHRRAVVELLGDGSRELAFSETVFDTDAKNYHAWAHRQWALKRFGLWDQELEFVEKMVKLDVRNNSAWNQRWYVVHSGPVPVTPDILQRELSFTFSSIEDIKRNESSWNYLRGLTNFHPEIIPEVLNKLDNLLQKSDNRNHLSLALLADLRQEEGRLESLQSARTLYKELIDIDSIRTKSWVRNIHSIDAKLATTTFEQK